MATQLLLTACEDPENSYSGILVLFVRVHNFSHLIRTGTDIYIVEYTLKLGEFILCRFKTISYNVHVLRTNKVKIKVSQCSTVERINEIEITCKIQNIFVDSFVNNK